MAKKKTAKTGKAARTKSAKRGARDVESNYPRHHFVAKLRRLADAIEAGKPFRIQIAGERVYISPKAVINLEHERSATEEEVEFQMRWPLTPKEG